jgi:hypothetical protein
MENDKNEYADLAIKAYLIRGIIINETTYIERLIDEYISSHFCKEQVLKEEIIARIFSGTKIGFTAKKELFLDLLKTHNEPFYIENINTINKLAEIVEFRNIVAHRVLDTSKEGLSIFKNEKAIYFRKLDGKQIERRCVFTDEMTDGLINKIREVIDILSILIPDFGVHPFPPNNPKHTA